MTPLYLFGVVVCHTGAIVLCHHHLVLSLARFGVTQPDLILVELAGNVRDHLAHVELLPSPIVTSVIVNKM